MGLTAMPNEPSEPADEAQSKRFIEKAKELGVEVDAEAFGRLIGQIAPVKPAVDPAHPSEKPPSA